MRYHCERPLHAISTRLAGKLAHWQNPALLQPTLRWFVDRYNVNMNEALRPELTNYRSFHDFFTRELKPGARPIATGDNTVVSPADGVISQMGRVRADGFLDNSDGTPIVAKGHRYNIQSLLGPTIDPSSFIDGACMTIYLSPRDYHRIHCPIDNAFVSHVQHMPGTLFSVSTSTVDAVDGLIARNERVVTTMQTPCGPIALVMVGAWIVRSVELSWLHEPVCGRGYLSTGAGIHYTDTATKPRMRIGNEFGLFSLGSTVVLLGGPNVQWLPELALGPIKMGQAIGQSTNT